ncbi:Ubiquinone biosynthesis protein coq9, mitochondrial [Kluyveromyces marxianus]|nr:Ubiquinone biosynthesis protein coq9, mitochondrial [Kluyveromyces marxianus]KAG0680266.1 Ubiquinone biosynthesis protein coq9, mitochondrial [Kluyveromyces marxianus]
MSSRVFTRLYHPNMLEHAIPKVIKPLTYGADSVQYKVLSNTIKNHVPTQGFNERAIVQSLNELGLGSSYLSVLGSANSPSFFNVSPAVQELVKFHLVTKRTQLINELPLDTDKPLPDLETLFLRRLKLNESVAPHLSQMLSIMSIPGEFMVQTALPELHRLTDDMIFYSNETDNHDFAWYSKRLAISTAYVSSELFMAQDKSHNFSETMEFAQSRLENVKKMGKMYDNTEEYLWFTLLSSINLVKSQLTRG